MPHLIPKPDGYDSVHDDIVELIDAARQTSARAINAVMTAAYWEIGRRIVLCEQGGEQRAEYGQAIMKRLSVDLTGQFGRGYSLTNLKYMRQFQLGWPVPPGANSKPSISSDLEKGQPVADLLATAAQPTKSQPLAGLFPLPWSHYVYLLAVKDEGAREFYEREALAGGWGKRQLKRQIDSKFYERVALSRNKAKMLQEGEQALLKDKVTPEEEIKDVYVLEFLGLKDEYSEHELEEALVLKLEDFLLELGNEFAFIGRQRRLRVGDQWFRIDLLLFHRGLRCLVIVDLKLSKLTPADAGQMHFYLNYAREHWTRPDENPPVGLILCAEKEEAVARYALEGLQNQVLASEYRMQLPEEDTIRDKLLQYRRLIDAIKEP